MNSKITGDFDKAMKEHIWLDQITLSQLSIEQYKEYLNHTLDLDHRENLRLYRGSSQSTDLVPGFVTSIEQMDLLISYLNYLRTKM